MNAALMRLERHERGIHAFQLGAGGARVTRVRFRVRMLPYCCNKAERIAVTALRSIAVSARCGAMVRLDASHTAEPATGIR